ncbi:signal peptidase II [Delftia tsuruhatensis]|uniref:signal peptidase II n=1 Tax=Comamonadaceae TaxID=80864 RepID=UPI0020900FE1|nr:signal peptidase II [Hydrogenophaga electricum]MCO5336982.1 signal peptidase II [Delftia tsuruhatensis]
MVSVWLVCLLSRPLRRLESLSYSLILGGALGNAFDRAVRGQVIDYLDFHLRGWHWPAFNIADMAIVGGVIALVLQSLVSAEQPTGAKESR